MALKTKIKLGISKDYKQIDVASLTGYGITGYGDNQDPAGYRILANGVSTYPGLKGYLLKITSPTGNVTSILGTPYDSFFAASNFDSFTIGLSNLALGYSADEQLEDGLWKADYTEFFLNDPNIKISWTQNNTYFTYIPPSLTHSSLDLLSFKNANYIYLFNSTQSPVFDTSYLYPITSPVVASSNKINTTAISQTSQTDYTGYLVGYTSTKYFPVAKSIKECLDNKVADLVECECDEVDAELINKYLLYDAMFDNCEMDNINKAQQIFDLLSKYCDDNCGCD